MKEKCIIVGVYRGSFTDKATGQPVAWGKVFCESAEPTTEVGVSGQKVFERNCGTPVLDQVEAFGLRGAFELDLVENDKGKLRIAAARGLAKPGTFAFDGKGGIVALKNSASAAA